MDWNDEQIEIGKKFNLAIERGQIDLVETMCIENAWLITDYKWCGKATWIERAARKGNVEMIKKLVSLGYNIHVYDQEWLSNVVETSITFDHLDMLRFVLSQGVDPNVGRNLIGAINKSDEDFGLEIAKLLVEHGVDVNQRFDFFGNEDLGFTALDVAEERPRIAAYLRAHGAKTSEELEQEVNK